MQPSTIPTAVSALRLILAPCVAAAVLAGQYWTALFLCLGAGITDFLDGYLARRLRAISRAGAYLDPISDKVLVSVTYVALGWTGDIPWWLVALVLSRDLLTLVAAVALHSFTGVKDFEPSNLGKLATGIHVVTLATVILNGAITGPVIQLAASSLIWLAGVCTLWSGVDYAVRGFRLALGRRN